MGVARQSLPARLFLALLGSEDSLRQGRGLAEKEFGRQSTKSPQWDFSHSKYYCAEMGAGLKRQIVSPRELIDPAALPEIKIMTNRWETDLSSSNKRSLNIDPGYLTEAKVVLATTKDYIHRLYLGGGIYGEVTLQYGRGEYRSLDYTYPDYCSKEYRSFFAKIRREFRAACGRSKSKASVGKDLQ
jgi:hypothetical protein